MQAEIVIIGAGVIGSGLAMALAEKGVSDVVVIDPDLEGTLSSSELNAGGVRATFNQEINVLSSKISIDYFSRHSKDVGYRDCGYLWMYQPERFEKALRDREKWQAQGWEVQAWTPQELQAKRPFIDRIDDLGGALFAPRDGLLNPNLLKLHFRNEAKKRGVKFVDRLLVRGSEITEQGVRLDCEKLNTTLSAEEKEAVFTEAERIPGEKTRITAARVVNCAGAWAGGVAKALGYVSPCFAVRRQICIFDCRDVDLSPYGMMIDSSGVYFHPEATNILGGLAIRDEPPGANFAYDGIDFFQEKVWLPLSERSSQFESLRHLTGWGGLYEVSPDESAIVGVVETGAPKGTGRVFESHSYSGHGVMHSYANGVALAEKIVSGRYETLDLSILTGSRFESGKLVSETAVI